MMCDLRADELAAEGLCAFCASCASLVDPGLLNSGTGGPCICGVLSAIFLAIGKYVSISHKMPWQYWFASQVNKHHESFTRSACATYADCVLDVLEEDAAAAELSSEVSHRRPTIIYLPTMMLVAYHMTQYAFF